MSEDITKDVNTTEASSASTTDNQATQTASQEPVAAPSSDAAPVDSTVEQDANTNAAAPSSAETDAKNKRKTLLDVVKNAGRQNPEPTSSVEGEEGKASEDSKQADAVKDDANAKTQKTEEKLPFHNHPRWKEVLSERDSYKTKADQYVQIEKYMEANGLQSQEVAEGFYVMSLIRNNPIEAYKVLHGHLQKLAPIVGVTLPKDIEEKVDQGSLDAESARELAQARARANVLSEQNQKALAAQKAKEEQARRESTRGAVVTWENSIRQRDPDYSAKQQFIRDRVRVMLQQGEPTSPQEAVALVEKAYAEVTEQMLKVMPRPQQARQVVSTSSSSVSAQPQPKSLLDVIRQASRS